MKQPISIYTSWSRAIPQITFAAILAFISLNMFPKDKTIVALATSFGIFMVYTFSIRFIVASDHRQGLSALSKNDFDAAIKHFEKSFDLFSNNQWLEKYGSVIFMSSSVWSYREMALMNIAATYSMKKDTNKYREANERLLKEYPNNNRAKDALEFLSAMRNEA